MVLMSVLIIVFYEDVKTQLKIVGDKGSPQKGDSMFSISIDSFLATLYMLSNLKFLFLVSLGFWGPLSTMILGQFSSLIILNSTSKIFYGNFSHEIYI